MKKIRRNLTKILTAVGVAVIAFGISLLTPLAQFTNGLRNRAAFAAPEAGEITRRPTLASVGGAGIIPQVLNMPKSTANLGDFVATKVGTLTDLDDSTTGVQGDPTKDLQIPGIAGFTYTYDKLEAEDYVLDNGETTTSDRTDGELDTVTVTVTAVPEVRIFFGLSTTPYESDTYLYAGSYEYRFYLGEHFADDQYFDSVTVTVSKSQYSFSSPITGNNENFIPTILPKPTATTTLKFPFPDKLNIVKDGTAVNLMDKANIDDLNEFFAEVGAKSDFTKNGTPVDGRPADDDFNAAIEQLRTYVRVSLHPNGRDTIIKNFTDTATVEFQFGDTAGKIPMTANTLSGVSYQLLNKPAVDTDTANTGSVLLTTTLTDITVRQNLTGNDIEFTDPISEKTNAPATLRLGVKETLPQPTIGATAPTDTTQTLTIPNAEAYTYVKSVKYMTAAERSEGKEWKDVSAIAANAQTDDTKKTIELLGGLEVRALKIGFYQFEYRTTTKWGFRHQDEDENWVSETNFIDYTTTNVEVKYSSTTTNFVWTDAYADKVNADGDAKGELQNGTEMSDLEDFAKYLPSTNNAAASGKPNTVEMSKGIIIPAWYAENSLLKQSELDYRVIISKPNTSQSTSYFENTHIRSSLGYDPTQKLYITFGNDPNQRNNIQQYDVKNGATSSANHPNPDWDWTGSSDSAGVRGFMANASDLTGEYKIEISVYSRKSLNPDSTSSQTTLLSTALARTYYFTVSDDKTKAPEIGTINIDNHYMADGDTLTVNVPNALFTDDYTASANINREYILNPNNSAPTTYAEMAELGTTGVKIDETPTSAGALSIDLTKSEYAAKIIPNAENTLRVVAKGFNQMQKELYGNPTENDSINKYDDNDTAPYDVGDAKYRDIKFNVYYLDNNPVTDVTYTFNGGDGSNGTNTTPSANNTGFGAELWEKATVLDADKQGETPLYPQNEDIYLPQIIADITGTAKAQMSVSIFQIDKGKRIFTNIYRDYEGVPTVVGAASSFTDNTTFADMYFTPSTAGDYIVFITAKAKASNTYFSFMAAITVKASGSASFTIDGGSTTLVVGERGYIPTVTLNLIDHNIVASDYDLNRIETDGSKTLVGSYTMDIRNIGANGIDPKDKSFVAKQSGTIDIVYNFKLTNPEYEACDGYWDIATSAYLNDPLTYTHPIVISDMTAADLTLEIDPQYNETFPDADGAKPFEGTNGDGEQLTNLQVMGLNGFTDVQASDAKTFIVDRSKTNSTWKENDPVYPMIAIPNLNPLPRAGIEYWDRDMLETPDIKVTYLDDSGSTQTLIDTANEDESKRLQKKSVSLDLNGDGNGDYYAFQPQGTFIKLNNLAPTADEDRYLFNNENYIYTITYTTRYGAGEPVTTTYTVKTGDRTEAAIRVGDIGKRLNDDGTVVEEDPLVYTYAEDMDVIKLDISKITIEGNTKFDDYMNNWILDNYELGEDGEPIADHRSANVDALSSLEGGKYYKDGALTDEGKKLSRAYYISKYLMIRIIINTEEWTYNKAYADRWFSNGGDAAKMERLTVTGAPEKTVYTFAPSMAATYEVTFSIRNTFTQSDVSAKQTITVNTDETETETIKDIAPKIWGWVLIILSSGLLIGVVFYFIKTGRDTKFGGTPKPEGKKVKAGKDVAAEEKKSADKADKKSEKAKKEEKPEAEEKSEKEEKEAE